MTFGLTTGLLVAISLRIVVFVLITWFVINVYRTLRRTSPFLATMLALGIVGRAFLGVSLFAISYFGLPIANGLQLGGGWSGAG